MLNHLRVRKSRLTATLMTIMSVFAFVLSPFYGVVAGQVAGAAPIANSVSKQDGALAVVLSCNENTTINVHASVNGSQVKGLISGKVKYSAGTQAAKHDISHKDTAENWTFNIDSHQVEGFSLSAHVYTHIFGITIAKYEVSNLDLNCDTAPPVVEIVTPSQDGVYNPAEVVVVARDNAKLSSFTVNVHNKTISEAVSGICGPIIRYSDTYWEKVCNVSELADGEYQVKSSAKDASGNSSQTQSRKFTVDKTKPLVQINGSNPVSKYNKSSGVNVRVFDSNLDYTTIERTDINKRPSDFWTKSERSFGLTWLKDGDYLLKAHDKAGNVEEVPFTYDKTKPVVDADKYATELSPDYNPDNLKLTATDPTEPNGHASGVVLVVGNLYKYNDAEGKYTFLKGNQAADTTTLEVDLSNLPEGKYYVKYNAHDGVKNVSNTEFYYFTIDTAAPTVTIDSVLRGSGGIYQIRGTSDDTAPVIVTVAGDLNSPYTATPDASGAWSIKTGVLAAGLYTVSAISKDAAGNIGSATPSPYPFTVALASVLGGGRIEPQLDLTNLDPSLGFSGQVVNLPGETEEDVLGETEEADESEGSVKAESDKTEAGVTGDDAEKGCSKLFGVCWYYWIPVVIIVAAVVWWLTSRRGRDAANA